MKPQFSFTEEESSRIKATVTLPSCVNSSVRSRASKKAWKTERAAAKDAAFHCYAALFTAGLLNESLLPLTHDWKADSEPSEQLSATLEVDPQIMLAAQMRTAWSSLDYYQTKVSVLTPCPRRSRQLSMILTTPARLANPPPLKMYWDAEDSFNITFEPVSSPVSLNASSLYAMRDITRLLHQSTRSDNTRIEGTDFVFLFSPDIDKTRLLEWLEHNSDQQMISDILREHGATVIEGVIRSPNLYGYPHLFQHLHPDPKGNHDSTEVECIPLPRRRNFAVQSASPANRTASCVRLLAGDCTADRLSTEYAKFNLFIPAILRHIEANHVAHQLRNTVLLKVGIANVQHIVTAITAPSANTTTNYQSYEFVGDAVLKFVSSVQLFADHTAWPEGYLSRRRDDLVSNNSLAKAALIQRLEVYIMTKTPKTRKWLPPRISDEAESNEKRELPMKMLADVVEALIGAAFIDSGLKAARACIHVFLPDIRDAEPEMPASPTIGGFKIAVDEANSLIGYKFHNEALLAEALTHPTFAGAADRESYQRLEFLGDAVLDLLVVNYLSAQRPVLSQGRMTHVKAALANAGLLGFVCLDYGVDRDVTQIQETQPDLFTTVRHTERVQLWRCMRFLSEAVKNAQQVCGDRYDRYSSRIREALTYGDSYPWALLARLNPDKFYSDIIESILGAIFVDSGGNLWECQKFFNRIGLGSYALRLTESSFNIVHPKNSLQQLAGSSKVEFDIKASEQAENLSASFRCRVLVDGTVLANIDGCMSSDEAVVVGADEAVAALTAASKGP